MQTFCNNEIYFKILLAIFSSELKNAKLKVVKNDWRRGIVKKKIMIMIAFMAIILLSIAAWFYSYYNRKCLDNIPASEKDFSISLTWGISGQGFYDSKTGTLIKMTNATNPEDYTTTLQLSEAEKNALYNLITRMDIEAYPEQYDPYNDQNAEIKIAGSKPSSKLILSIQTDTIDKTIECSCVLSFGEGKGYNDEAQAFLDLCEQIYSIIILSEEWKALPEYEVLYE